MSGFIPLLVETGNSNVLVTFRCIDQYPIILKLNNAIASETKVRIFENPIKLDLELKNFHTKKRTIITQIAKQKYLIIIFWFIFIKERNNSKKTHGELYNSTKNDEVIILAL